jgi:SagB-type dehydrogenase family enzyme
MKKAYIIILIILSLALLVLFFLTRENMSSGDNDDFMTKEEIKLPEARLDSDVSIEKSLWERRSFRDYQDEALSLSDIAQILWASQGITSSENLRTAPSAGATYPLEVYLIVGNVEDLSPGVYRYDPSEHKLEKFASGDKRESLYRSALNQSWIRDGAVSLVFTAVYERTTGRYGERGIRYVYMEAGHAAQNVYLQAVSLNLGTVVVGAFSDNEVKEILNIPENEQPLYIMPIGKIK